MPGVYTLPYVPGEATLVYMPSYLCTRRGYPGVYALPYVPGYTTLCIYTLYTLGIPPSHHAVLSYTTGTCGTTMRRREGPGLSWENNMRYEAHRALQPPKGVMRGIPLRRELLRLPEDKRMKIG